MADVSYVPGGRTAIVGDSCWVLIDASPDSAVVAEIWRRTALAGPLLDGLLAGIMQFGFAHMPDFALLVAGADGRRHLICRGSGSAAIDGIDGRDGGGTRRVSGAGLATWLDYPMPAGVRSVVIGEPATEGSLLLPASAGIFLASSVIVDLAAAGRDSRPLPGVPAAPGPAAPEPAPAAPGWPPQEPLAAHAPPVPVAYVAEEPDGTGYDFLFEATQMRSVEDAAIRPDSGGDSLFSFPGGATSFPGLQPPSPAPAPVHGTRPSGLIESVPWVGTAQPMPSQAMPSQAMDPSGTLPPRSLISTITVPPPLIPGVPPGSIGSTGGFQASGDATPPQSAAVENTNTIRRGSLSQPVPVPALADRIGPTVHALVCPAGHVSPPSSVTCRVCAEPLSQQDPVTVPRPALGVLRLSTGDVITLDRGVVMGRNPRSEFDGDERPHIVKLPSGDGEISRTHLIVTLDGWHVLVTDLNSTNGTLVELPGRPPERLRASEPTPIPNGTLVTLADGIYFTFEVGG